MANGAETPTTPTAESLARDITQGRDGKPLSDQQIREEISNIYNSPEGRAQYRQIVDGAFNIISQQAHGGKNDLSDQAALVKLDLFDSQIDPNVGDNRAQQGRDFGDLPQAKPGEGGTLPAGVMVDEKGHPTGIVDVQEHGTSIIRNDVPAQQQFQSFTNDGNGNYSVTANGETHPYQGVTGARATANGIELSMGDNKKVTVAPDGTEVTQENGNVVMRDKWGGNVTGIIHDQGNGHEIKIGRGPDGNWQGLPEGATNPQATKDGISYDTPDGHVFVRPDGTMQQKNKAGITTEIDSHGNPTKYEQGGRTMELHGDNKWWYHTEGGEWVELQGAPHVDENGSIFADEANGGTGRRHNFGADGKYSRTSS